MKRSFIKRHEKLILFVEAVLVFLLCTYIFAPWLSAIGYRRDTGGMEEWMEQCHSPQKELSFLFVYSNMAPWDGEEIVHEPLAGDSVFTFDGNIKLDDGIYLTSVRGITDWTMGIHIYSRKYLVRDISTEVLGQWKLWPFYITCKGSEDSAFPSKANHEVYAYEKFWGYSAALWLSAPVSINEDDTITLVYHYGDNYEKEREIKVPVEHRKIGEWDE